LEENVRRLKRDRSAVATLPAECTCGDLAAAQACRTALPLFQGRIALRLGDWETALRLMREQYDLADAAGSKSALLDSICSIFVSLYLIGDHAAASAMLPQLLETHGITEPHFQMRTYPFATLLALESGRIDEASEHLKHCHKILEHGEDWRGMAGLVVRADAALAAAQNRFEEAASLFADSIKIFRKFGLVWETADTFHYWGRALINFGDKEDALNKLDAAIELYRRYQAGQRWIDRVAADRARAADALSQPASFISAANGAIGLFRLEGDYWTVSMGTTVHQIKDARGLHYIAHLLRNKGLELAATDLANLVSSSTRSIPSQTVGAGDRKNFSTIRKDLGDAAPRLDAKAKADYARRIKELNVELDEAERFNDFGSLQRIKEERDLLVSELKAALGKGGIDRRIASHRERARSTVSKRIRFTIHRISRFDPQLADHLDQSIRTGFACAYLPSETVEWQL
jgi:tetratricopeptide (TPR) repeat protein